MLKQNIDTAAQKSRTEKKKVYYKLIGGGKNDGEKKKPYRPVQKFRMRTKRKLRWKNFDEYTQPTEKKTRGVYNNGEASGKQL